MADNWNFGYLKNIVTNAIDYNDIENIVEDAINETIQDIMSESQWHFMFGTVDLELTSGSEEVSPPSGIEEIHRIYDEENDRVLEAITEHEFVDRFIVTPTEGTPEYYTYFEGDGKLRFHQVPDGLYNLKIFGILSHPILESDDEEILIPRKYLSVIKNKAVAICKEFMDRPSSTNLNLYEAGLTKMKRFNNKLRAINRGMEDQFLKGRILGKGPIWRTGGYNYK